MFRIPKEPLPRHRALISIPVVVQDHPASSGVQMTSEFLLALAAEAPACRVIKLEEEPTPRDYPILALDNVITTPHALCWTDECFRRIAEDAFASVVAVARGAAPVNLVNRAVLDNAAFTAALAARRNLLAGGPS